jgi:hypothetical protein
LERTLDQGVWKSWPKSRAQDEFDIGTGSVSAGCGQTGSEGAGMGFVVTAGELYRSPEQQEIYHQDRRSKTMDSLHLKRLAIDLNFFKDGKLGWRKNQFWLRLGRSGSRFIR